MLFHSYEFVAFLLVVLGLYWTLGRRGQNILLLVASYVFYGWLDPWLVLLLAGYTAVNYTVARLIEAHPAARKPLLGVSVAACLGVLGYFKYADFLIDTVVDLAAAAGVHLSPTSLRIILPVGISFYTFQTLGYVIDVYRGRMAACRRPLDFALFIAFFPQLVAGPIERASHMLGQFANPRRFDSDRAQSGVALIVWGLFKKIVIAETAAGYANNVFMLEDPGFALLWAGVFAFGVQIYADFSAYSDIARGTARLMGIELVRNFRHPYIAVSPSSFWRRWHISLSFWFRDYVYLPLGGSRRPTVAGNSAVLLVTFAATGLWHGASWTFLIWGLIHALAILCHRALRAVLPEAWRALLGFRLAGWAATFLVVHIAWLTFRETDPGQLLALLALNPADVTAAEIQAAAYIVTVVLLYSLPLWLHALLDERTDLLRRLDEPAGSPGAALTRTATAALGAAAIALFGADQATPFIYFQF